MNLSQFATATYLPLMVAICSFVLLALTICRNGVPKYCHTRPILKAVMIIAVFHVLWNCINAGYLITVFSFYHSSVVWIVITVLGFYLNHAGFQQGRDAFLGEVVNRELAAAYLQGLNFEVLGCVFYMRVGAQDIAGGDPDLKETTNLWYVTLRCTTPGLWYYRNVMYIHKGIHKVLDGAWEFDGRGKLQKIVDHLAQGSCCP